MDIELKHGSTLALLCLLMSAFSPAHSACEEPKNYDRVPSGKQATRSQMLDAKHRLDALNDYLICDESEVKQITEKDEKTKRALRHNELVDRLGEFVACFNEQLAAFRQSGGGRGSPANACQTSDHASTTPQPQSRQPQSQQPQSRQPQSQQPQSPQPQSHQPQAPQAHSQQPEKVTAQSSAPKAPSPTAGSGGAERRVALVIGNSSYVNRPLRNPANDAEDMANKLAGLGFQVVRRTNLLTRQIGGALREFRTKLAPGGIGVFFYAGHGIQVRGANYFPSVDSEISTEDDVANQSLSMQQVLDILEESKVGLSLVFLDACRDNPYASSFRSASRGLARMTPPSGTLISYATRPGSVAADGSGRNGLYTRNLLEGMNVADEPVEQVLKHVGLAVKRQSNGQQEPWMEGYIEGDFYFRRLD